MSNTYWANEDGDPQETESTDPWYDDTTGLWVDPLWVEHDLERQIPFGNGDITSASEYGGLAGNNTGAI